jgi:hypothetical protein
MCRNTRNPTPKSERESPIETLSGFYFQAIYALFQQNQTQRPQS